MKSALRRYGPAGLKILLSAACLWYAFTKPDWTKLIASWQRMNLAWIAVALGTYTLSKILASNRLNINFRLIGIQLTESRNRALYWLGMLYNLLLPGAITGDAYKVVVLGKHPGASRRSLTLAVLLDRFSGLLSLLIIIALLGILLFPHAYWTMLFLPASLILIPLSFWIIRWLLPQQAPGFRSTLLLGAGVQLLVVATVWSLIQSLQIQPHLIEYLFVFLVAAATSVLPISIGGGLGIREFASIQLAAWMNLSVEDALLLSLVFYGVTVAVALPGFHFIFRVGLITRYLATTGAHIIAFEPDPRAFAILKKRCGHLPNVTLRQEGVWDKQELLPLFDHAEGKEAEAAFTVGSSLIAAKKNVDTARSRQVPLIDLIEFLRAQPKKVSLIKLDVEGAEIAILQKIIREKAWDRFERLYVETHETKIPEQGPALEAIRRELKENQVTHIKLDWI